MVQRTMPGPVSRRRCNGRAHIGPGADHGVPQRKPLRQARRHRTRKRAARAMGMAGLNAPDAEDGDVSYAVQIVVLAEDLLDND
jgi:hypothetical protein